MGLAVGVAKDVAMDLAVLLLILLTGMEAAAVLKRSRENWRISL